jgi:hypothetical protein
VPKDLTDVSQWETVEVPVGTDPATAGSVETPLQLLADRSRFLLDFLASMRLLNWRGVDLSVGANNGGLGRMAWEPIIEAFVDVVETAAGVGEELLAGPGADGWAVGTPPTIGAVGAYPPSIAADGLGNLVVATGLANPGHVSMRWRNGITGAYSVPAAWGANGPTGQFRAVTGCKFGVFHFIAADVDGPILIVQDNAHAWGSPTGPGFTSGQGARALRSSEHPAGLLGPDDAGNQAIVALSALQKSHSVNDGLNWSAAAAHGLGGNPHDLAYSALGQRWIAPVLNFPAGTFRGLGVSDDNGATWTLDAASIVSSLSTVADAQIASDGLGGWALMLTGTNYELWVSWDNGVNWRRIRLPLDGALSSPQGNIRLAYGGGRFAINTDDGSGVFAAYMSLRANG